MTNNERISSALQSISCDINERLFDITGTEDYDFALVIFSKTPSDRINFVSSTARCKVAQVWKFLIQRWDSTVPDVPIHGWN